MKIRPWALLGVFLASRAGFTGSRRQNNAYFQAILFLRPRRSP